MSPLPSSNASSNPVSVVSCPQCGESVRWSEESAFRPFCSKRCRLIDLGEWIDERNTIPGEPAPWPENDGSIDH